MKTFVTFALVFLVGAAIGYCYDWAAWNYHLRYIRLDWLGPLIGADGEGAYDAMTCESMIDLGIALVATTVCVKFLVKRLRSMPDAPSL